MVNLTLSIAALVFGFYLWVCLLRSKPDRRGDWRKLLLLWIVLNVGYGLAVFGFHTAAFYDSISWGLNDDNRLAFLHTPGAWTLLLFSLNALLLTSFAGIQQVVEVLRR